MSRRADSVAENLVPKLRSTVLPALFLLFWGLIFSIPGFAQTESATLSGTVMDSSGAVVADAQVQVTNADTNITVATKTNGSGIYVVPALKPGRYRVVVTKQGFKQITLTDVTLNVQDTVSRNFTLEVGATSETIVVNAGGTPLINTESASVSTVVDRQFAENLPLNGRSFQTLIQLTPGVVLTRSSSSDSGQFSVNGQRADANYWMVDGVSANVGIGLNPGNGAAGAQASFSILGGTNSLVSVDAMQEFRIQTSTYAPEFGRTPGGQISIVTRSGTNQFHGTAFNYLRNDALDANYWFNGFVTPKIPKAKERQNDFGGTLGGPIIRNRTFFFFSYEGLRLRLPVTSLSSVPDVLARQSAVSAMQPYLNAFPLPNGTDNPSTGVAQFNASYSNPATLDAYSLRIDDKLSDKWTLFGRYSYSPSKLTQRGFSFSLSTVVPQRIVIQTATGGATWMASSVVANDFRFNYSRTKLNGSRVLDNFGGAVPLTSFPFPTPFSTDDSTIVVVIVGLQQGALSAGRIAQNIQRQVNVVDSLSAQRGNHTLKLGVDFRRLSPSRDPQLYSQQPLFLSVTAAKTGNALITPVLAGRSTSLAFRNLGVFGQDTWRVSPRFVLTFGLRWDVDFAPSSVDGPALPAVTGFNLTNPSSLTLTPEGTHPFETSYRNFAPRVGAAYQLSQHLQLGTVIRGGFGVFYDLATSEVGTLLSVGYPFGASKLNFGATFPLSASAAAPPPITAAQLSAGTLFAVDPNLKLPYAMHWNVALEQLLGIKQTASVSYVGSVGRRLLQSSFINAPNPSFGSADLVSNTASSDYHSLQLQFKRRLSRGVQGLVSYTWSHSIDEGSAGSYNGNGANTLVPALGPEINRGPSDFDIRSAFSAGGTYDVPAPKFNAFANAILGGWSIQSFVIARSAPPVNVFYSSLPNLSGASTQVRPNLNPAVPLYLFGNFPGGKAFNPNAFVAPPLGPTGLPLNQGNVSRNALRGFGAAQWDFSLHRDFPVRESLKLQFRAEMFNVLNHPNFGAPIGDLGSPASLNSQFGKSNQMLGQFLSATAGGGFNPLYQIGGPRSIQFALKLSF